MANHKSAIKRARQNIKRRLRNRMTMSVYRTELKKFITMMSENNMEDAKKLLPSLHKIIDKTRSKGVIHKNNAARKKSRLDAMLNKATSAA